MLHGIYLATNGMTPLLDKQEQIANNLANVNTTGFKQSGLFLKTYQKQLANDQQQPFATQQMKADEVYIDYSEGTMRQTDAPLDLCIKGSGFFTVMTDNGIAYTRNGNFALDAQGMLITSDGSKVMGKEGYIEVDKRFPMAINQNGEVVQKGEVKGELRIVDFDKPYKMMRLGESRFRPASPGAEEKLSAGFEIRSGYLESSNVNVIRNMVQMISTYRNFEADQRALQAQDQTLDKAVNQVGRLG